MRRGFIVLATAVAAAWGMLLVGHLAWRGGHVLDCVLCSVPLAVAIWAARGRLQNVAIAATSLALGLAVVQAAFLVLGPAKNAVAFNDGGMMSANDALGWAPRHPGVFHLVKTRADGHVIFDVHATIGDAYDRVITSAPGAHPIAFFGDSFVFGDGLNDSETLPQAFADLGHRRTPVLNLALSGWAPSQNLAALQLPSIRARLGRPLRIILFTATFHVERIACKGAYAWSTAPRYEIEGDTVRRAGPCVGTRPRWLNTILRTANTLLRPDPTAAQIGAHDVETYVKVIETFVSTARRDYGAETTVLMEPDGDDYLGGTGFTEDGIIETLRGAGIDVLLKAPFPPGEKDLYQIPDEGHPTGFANRVIARQLADHLRAVDPKALPD